MNRFQAWYRVQPRALRALLTINVVVYVLWLLFFIHFGTIRAFVGQHLALNPSLPGILFQPWQLITYSFLHLQPGFWGLIHIGFNMLWLYWIGKEYEELHGADSLFAAYVAGGVGGALLTVVLHAIFPGVGAFGGIVHGASASVLGVITAVAIRYPFKSIALLLLGPIRLIYLVIGYLALNLLFLSGGSMSVSAHFGGALFGYLLAKGEMRGMDLSSWARVFFPGSGRRRYSYGPRTTRGEKREGVFEKFGGWIGSKQKEKEEEPRKARIHQLRTSEVEETESVNAELEVDRILDKISESGYESLTEEEKKVLYEASRR